MESSFKLFRVRGIEIGANWSWLFLFGYLIWVLATVVFPDYYPGLGSSTYLVMAITAGVLFFVSLLLHELGHAFRAQKEGMEIEGITLWFFGGVAKFKGMFPSAGAEFRIAIAGPLVTAVLILLYGGAALALGTLNAPTSVRGVFAYLWLINMILLVFNMIPALPLDGGRVLRSALWHRSGNFTGATIQAARIARVFATAMIAIGLLAFVMPLPVSPLTAVIGYFLLQASRAEVAYAVFRQSLGGMRVGELMTPNPASVDPDRTIASFIDDVAYARGHSTYPVVGPMGELVGLMSLRRAAAVPEPERALTRVRDVMLPREDVPVLDVAADIPHAMQKLQEGPGRAVVLDMSRPVGILSMSDIARAPEIQGVMATPGTLDAVAPRRRRRGLWIFATLAALAAFAVLWSPPFVIITPGQAFDVTPDIKVTGVKADKVNGKYLLTSVAVGQPTFLGLIVSLAEGKQVLAQSDVVPDNVDPEEYFKQQEALFTESQTISAAAAAKAAGLKVKLDGSGALVRSVVPGKPAAEVLRPGDVITAIDGQPAQLAGDVVSRIRSKRTGSEFTLRVKRRGKTFATKIRTEAGIVQGAPGIGAMLETADFDVKLPFKVKFRKRDIGGPSAGLTYALAVYDMLVPDDIARGRIVATTGTMDLDGTVGPIGGIEEKAIAAKRSHAQIFLVPEAEVEGVKEPGLDVRGVRTLKGAIQILRVKA